MILRSSSARLLVAGALVACGSEPTLVVGDAGTDAASSSDAGSDGAVPVDAVADAPSTGDPGTALWAKRYGESGDVTPIALGVDGQGNSFYAGSFTGTINLAGTGPSGAEALVAATETGYVAKLDPSGNHLWSKKWVSTTQGAYPVAIATDKNGASVFVGQFYGTANLGGTPLVSGGTFSAFVAKLDAAGTHVWSKGFDGGLGTNAYALSVATDSAGDVIVAGQFLGSLDLGGGAMISAGSRDYFVAKLGGTDGHHIWSKRYGDAADQSGIALALDPTNDAIALIGRFAGSVDFGGGALVGNGTSGFVAQLDKAGVHQWSKLLATAQPRWVATDSGGNVYYTGGFVGTVDFAGTGNAGAEVLTATGSGANVFLTKLGANGAHKYSRAFAGSSYQDSVGLGIGPGGEAVISGQFRQGALDLSAGGVTAAPLGCAGQRNFYVASFTPAGAHHWSFCIGTAATFQEGTAVAVASSGHVFVNGDFYQPSTPSMAFPKAGGGSIVLTRTSSVDAFAAKLAP